MQTQYVGPMQADLNDQARTLKAELRVEPSEAFEGHLGLSVNSHSSGSEVVLVHLNAAQVDQLTEALATWRAEQTEA